MRYIIIVLLVTFSIECNAQDQQIVKTKYTKLESINQGFSSFLTGNSANLEFALVELINLTQQDTLYGVEVTVEREQNEVVGSSLSLGNIGSIWGGSSSVTIKNIQNEGYIFLDLKDVQEVIDFLNEALTQHTMKATDKYQTLTLQMYDSFKIGFLYDNGWDIIVGVDDTNYKLQYMEGMEMITALNNYRKFIEANQPISN